MKKKKTYGIKKQTGQTLAYTQKECSPYTTRNHTYMVQTFLHEQKLSQREFIWLSQHIAFFCFCTCQVCVFIDNENKFFLIFK